jgi:transcriptional regulator with XRE-family HTH domain
MRTGELRARRKAAGLSISDLAATVGVHPSTVVRWETGARRPTRADHAKRLASALGIHVVEITATHDSEDS